MNEHHDKLREIVEQATAPGKRVPDDLDAETASLRRGWLELGKLIEQDIRSDESRDDAQLGIEMAEFGRMLDAQPHRTNAAATSIESLGRASAGTIPARRRPHAWSYVLMAAASLLIGVGLAFAFRFVSVLHQQPGDIPVAKNPDSTKQPIGPIVAHPSDDGDELIALSDDSVKRITSLSRATMVVVVPFSLF